MLTDTMGQELGKDRGEMACFVQRCPVSWLGHREDSVVDANE